MNKWEFVNNVLLSPAGVITVAFENGEDGEVRLIAHPKAAFTAMPPSPNACTYPPWVRLKCSTGESIHKGNNRIVSKGTSEGRVCILDDSLWPEASNSF